MYLLFHFKVSSIAGNGSALNPSINGEYKCVASNIAGLLTFSKQITTNWVDIFIHNKLGKLVVLGIGVAVIVSVFLLMGVIYFYKRQKVLNSITSLFHMSRILFGPLNYKFTLVTACASRNHC